MHSRRSTLRTYCRYRRWIILRRGSLTPAIDDAVKQYSAKDEPRHCG